MNISQIKKSGREIIKGNVKNSAKFLLLFTAGLVLFSVLPFLTDIFLGGISAAALTVLIILLIICTVLYAAFSSGSKAWFLFYNRKKRGGKALYWLKPSRALGSAGIYAAMFFRKAFWTVIFTLPGNFLIILAVFAAMNGGVEFNLFVSWITGGCVLAAVGAGFLYVFLQRYFLVPYLRAADPSMKSSEMFSLSRKYMAGGLGKTALLKVSFLPWFLLSFTIVPVFYAWSYYSQSCALMAYEILKIQKKKETA